MNAPIRRTMLFPAGAMSYLEWEGARAAPLLVFSHANGFNASTYRSLLQPLAGAFRIVAPDFRGHGLSTLPTDVSLLPGWDIFRDDLIRLVDGLRQQPAVLAGHSLGASTSLLAAAAEPAIAKSLVLAEPVMASDRVALTARLARFLGIADRVVPLVASAMRRRTRFASREDAVKGFIGRGAFKTWLPEVIADYVETGLVPEGDAFRLACSTEWEAASFAVFPFRLAQAGAKLTMPVTVVCGTVRSSATPSVLEGFMRRHADTRLVQVEGASHFLPMEHPDALRAEIRRAAGLEPAT